MSEPLRGPIWITTVELDHPLPELCPPTGPDGDTYVSARLLVRVHSHPMGELEVPLTPAPPTADRLAQVIQDGLGDAIAAHQQADGLTVVPVSPDGFGLTPEMPPCSWQARLAALGREAPLVSVVLATCRRPARLLQTLQHIAAQTYPHIEVLVVDNAPWEPGADAAVASLHDPRFQLLAEWTPGASLARNRGLAAAQGEVVAFTDDDVDVDPDWIGNLAVPFYEDATLGCVTGLILPASLDSEAEQLFEQFGGFSKGFLPRTFGLADTEHGPLYPYNAGLFGSGASAAFRRDVITALGGFPPDLGPATVARGGEDLDAYLSVLHAGHRLMYEPAAIVWHEHRQTPRQLARQVYSYGIGLSAMITKRVIASPAERRAVLRALPAAVRYVLASDSAKNEARTTQYPKRLTAYEIAGLAYGPVAYLRSRHRRRRQVVG